MISIVMIKLESCPCCSGRHYSQCCQSYVDGHALPPTPEALMRSRYTAYTQANIDYIQQTMQGYAAQGFNPIEAKRWAKRIHWIKLDVRDATPEGSLRSFVEFIAILVDGKKLTILHEKSEFILKDGRWYYIDGIRFPSEANQIISRNSPCPCGRQRKFKYCHGK